MSSGTTWPGTLMPSLGTSGWRSGPPASPLGSTWSTETTHPDAWTPRSAGPRGTGCRIIRSTRCGSHSLRPSRPLTVIGQRVEQRGMPPLKNGMRRGSLTGNAGTKGFSRAADCRLGGMSGLGSEFSSVSHGRMGAVGALGMSPRGLFRAVVQLSRAPKPPSARCQLSSSKVKT